ncbi:MAG: hypothetical protein CMJ82_02170 [Planctomycetaceae bacterium]|nr:hypothetical protein [Planctomycetaceae bacterium]|tara:strand:+ start:1657 stop:2172 length:516 start_codon:yes stop_codon:yes gene_type:complete
MNAIGDGDTFVIRESVSTDLEAIERITLNVFGPSTFEKNIEDIYGTIAGRDWKWRKRRHLELDLSDEDGQCLVAVLEGDVKGYVTIRLDQESCIGVIPNLAVKESAAGLGLGGKLIEAALDVMKKAGMELARIETLEQNQIGQHLYPKMGFKEFARQIYYAMDLRSNDEHL